MGDAQGRSVRGRIHFLLALFAPGSAEAEVGALQERIFRDRGLASAVALPPVIPVAFLEDAPPRGFLRRLDLLVCAPYRFRARALADTGSDLFLAVDSGGVWDALRAGMADEAREVPGPFAAFEGFFLGCNEQGALDRAPLAFETPSVCFSSCTLAVARLSLAALPRPWWAEAHGETLEERPLKGKRK